MQSDKSNSKWVYRVPCKCVSCGKEVKLQPAELRKRTICFACGGNVVELKFTP